MLTIITCIYIYNIGNKMKLLRFVIIICIDCDDNIIERTDIICSERYRTEEGEF